MNIHLFYLIFLFSVVNKAWKTLENEETRAKCMDVIEEAKARTDHMVHSLFQSIEMNLNSKE